MNQTTKYKYFKKQFWEKLVKKYKKKIRIACQVHNKQIIFLIALISKFYKLIYFKAQNQV